MYAIHDGVVGRGFQFASGEAVGRNVDPSPFSRGTLRLQDAHFQARGFDLADAIPGLHWGTVNVELGVELVLASPDLTLSLVDWTAGESDPAARIAPDRVDDLIALAPFLQEHRQGLGRVLQIRVHRDDRFAPRCGEAREQGVLMTEIA